MYAYSGSDNTSMARLEMLKMMQLTCSMAWATSWLDQYSIQRTGRSCVYQLEHGFRMESESDFVPSLLNTAASRQDSFRSHLIWLIPYQISLGLSRAQWMRGSCRHGRIRSDPVLLGLSRIRHRECPAHPTTWFGAHGRQSGAKNSQPHPFEEATSTKTTRPGMMDVRLRLYGVHTKHTRSASK